MTYGKHDWKNHRRMDRAGTFLHGGKYLAYCAKCKEPFGIDDYGAAISMGVRCPECPIDASKFVIARPFEERKEP